MDETTPSSPCDHARERRVQQLLEEALEKPSALAATLGAITVDLITIAEPIAKTLQGVLQESTDLLGDLDRHHHAMDTYLKVARQIDRFSGLVQRESERSEISGA